MKILLSWLKEYLDIDDVASLGDLMTRAGIEVDHVEELVSSFHGVVAAQIREVIPHPHAAKLVVAKVFDGKKEHTVICGASNCRIGLITAYAPIGATVAGKRIETCVFGELHSHGMLCSEKELGLSDFHDGIMQLAQDHPLGTFLENVFNDILYEVSLTPNLGHCQSVMGLARELSAHLGKPMKKSPWAEEAILQTGSSKKLQVSVQDPTLCPRYSACLIEEVTCAPSPSWLRVRLERCGYRSLNAVVDVTNYISHDIGQPLHAFDADRVHDGHLIVRASHTEESLTFLDGAEKKLPDETIVIADAKHALAAAGIMGGESSAVSAATKRIILESAYFNPASIRKARTKLQLSSDASKRFERGADSSITLKALEMAYSLLQGIIGNCSIEAVSDSSIKIDLKKVACRISRSSLLLGYEVSSHEIESAFQRLGLQSDFDGQDTFFVCVPTFRHDITEEVDLIEEVGRLVGLQRKNHVVLRHSSSRLPHHPMYVFEQEVRRRLLALGLQEAVTCDLISSEMAHRVCNQTVGEASFVKMLNPLSSEQSVLRPSLLPGLLDVLQRNHSVRVLDLSLFEVGHVHFKKETNYQEPLVFGMLLTGKARPVHFAENERIYDFYDLKGMVEALFHTLHFTNIRLQKSDLSIFHPGRQAKIYVNDIHVGMLGELHPEILKTVNVPERVLFAECDVQELLVCQRPLVKMQPLAVFPASERDWTVTVSKKASFDEIMDQIGAVKSELLENTSLMGIYQSEKLGSDRHNVTLRFVYRDLSKTVSQEEVELAHQKLVRSVSHYLAEKYPE